MTSGEKLFFFILAFPFLVGNTVPLEFSLVPKINCHDLNGNGIPDFVAMPNSDLPRTLYHIELSSTKTDILWEFTMSDDKKGYFVDVILGDFDNDGTYELIAVAYQDEEADIFYIFSADSMGFYGDSPTITALQNTSSTINNPRRLYIMEADENQRSMFLISQGSPNRKVMMCEFIDNIISARGSLGEKFLQNTMATIDIALGDFNGEGGEDIYLLDNGFNPAGYFIYSDGNEEESNLSDYPQLRLLNEKGVDINFDGTDDLVIINRKGELMSDIWGTESIPLSEKKIQNIIINPNNGFIYLTSINQTGKIGNYSIDPLTRNILSSDFELPVFTETDYSHVYSLATAHEIFISHDGDKPEIWSVPLSMELISDISPPTPLQRIYYQEPDYVINAGKDFSHYIEWDSSATFRNFTEKYVPSGMEFDLDKIKLVWIPKHNQLGYHELSYALELRAKGSLEMDTDEGKKIVSQNEYPIKKNYSFLIYVNDPVSFRHEKDRITIINGELFEWIIPIDDENADVRLVVKKISGMQNAKYYLLPPEVIQVPFDTMSVFVDTVDVDTNGIKLEVVIDTLVPEPEEPVYVDTVQTEFEDFTVQKLESETDPFKKKKLETADEDFKTQEEKYREKLKTHKKIIRDGKNIWIPKDSLMVLGDSIIIKETEITVGDSLETHLNDSLQIVEGKVDTLSLTETIQDTLTFFETIVEKTAVDTNYLEISSTELIAHEAQFSWTPQTEPGDYDFIITVTDGFTADTTEFTLTVHPEIDLSMNQTQYNATVDEIFSTDIILKQYPTSENFTYNLINAPENMRIDTSGTINWVPLPTQVDDYNFEIEVTDGIATTILPYKIYVNALPVISSRPQKIFILPQGQKLNFPMESFDLNSNTKLEWKLLFGPSNMTLNPEGFLQWNGNELGYHPYEIQLSDEIDSVLWKAHIYVNALPVIISQPVTVVTKGEKYEYTLAAKDENIVSPYDSLMKNEIIFSLVQGPEGLNIDENNMLNWETENVPLGEYMIAITASDGADDAIQVFPIFINSLPVITSSDSLTIQAGDSLHFQIEAHDLNRMDTLTYHLDSLLGNMVMELHMGLLTWVPEKTDIGVHNFNLQVKDGHDQTGTEVAFRIFVYTPPQLTSKLSSEAFSNLEYTAFLTAENMYGNKLSSPEAIIIDTASFNYFNLSEYAHLFKWTPREVDKGNHEMVIKVTDDFGFTTYHTHKLSVFTNPCVHCDKDYEDTPADTTGN